MKKEIMHKDMVLSLISIIFKIIHGLEEKENLEDDSTEKLVKILLKLSNIVIKLHKIQSDVQLNLGENEGYKFQASEISIMEDYIEKLKRFKIEKGENIW